MCDTIICDICFDDVLDTGGNDGNKPVVTKCGHIYHKLCMANWHGSEK